MTRRGGAGARGTGTGWGRMRTIRAAVLAAVTTMAVASLPGCGGDSPGSEATGSAVTRGAAPSNPSESGGTPDSAASDTAGGPGRATSTGAEPTKALPRLSTTGLGDLKLGMSLKQAKALGLVGKAKNVGVTEGCDQYRGKNGVSDLYFTDDQLIIIAVGPKIRLETGVGVGSTYQDLHGAYGDLIEPDDGTGKIYVSAPQAPFPAHYQIELNTGSAFRDSKITGIALQSVDQACYG